MYLIYSATQNFNFLYQQYIRNLIALSEILVQQITSWKLTSPLGMAVYILLNGRLTKIIPQILRERNLMNEMKHAYTKKYGFKC